MVDNVTGIYEGRSRGMREAVTRGPNKPYYLLAYELRARGYDYATIARILYGSDDERAQSRVRRLVAYARQRLTPYIESLYAEQLVREGKRFVSEKKRLGGVARQWLEHQMLMTTLLERLGFQVRSPVWEEMNWWHAKLFPIALESGLKMRCWRNGRSKKYPFSCTPDSIAYVHALLSALLLSKGFIYKRGELDVVMKHLLNPQQVEKAMRRYHKVAGVVFTAFFGPRTVSLG